MFELLHLVLGDAALQPCHRAIAVSVGGCYEVVRRVSLIQVNLAEPAQRRHRAVSKCNKQEA
jgi:hypothetical protein